MKKSLTLPLLAISVLNAQFSNAQNWTSIPTPVTTNLILYDIDFPAGQNDIGYAGGSNVTYNGHGTVLKTETKEIPGPWRGAAPRAVPVSRRSISSVPIRVSRVPKVGTS